LVIFSVLSLRYTGTESEQIQDVLTALSADYNVSAWLLLVPLIVPVLVLLKVPTLPTLLASILAGSLCYVFFQGGDFNHLFNLYYGGYEAVADNEIVANLLNQGG